MAKWKVVTETQGATITRTYIVDSDEEPTDIDDLSGAMLLDSESDDYDDEMIMHVERDK
jgi:hypothetical protein